MAVPHLDQQKEKEISMLAFPDSNSLSDYENIFKYIFKYGIIYVGPLMENMALSVLNRKKILIIEEDIHKNHL